MSALPAAPDKPRVVQAMFDRIAPRYDLLNRILEHDRMRLPRLICIRHHAID